MNAALPTAIAAYFGAANAHDADAAAACFAEDAIVIDERQTITGRSAIQEWKQAVNAKYHALAEIRSIESSGGVTRVVASVSGDFPGSPVDLRYSFRLVEEKIAALEIG